MPIPIRAFLCIAAMIWLVYPLIVRAQGTEAEYYPQGDETVVSVTSLTWEEIEGNPVIVETMVRAAFPDAPIMIRIAQAESQFYPKAKNPNSTATGVFQILIGTWEYYECAGDRKDASDNIACARKIYDREGTKPWNSSKENW